MSAPQGEPHDHGRDHGEPFAWDPDAARVRRGKWLIAAGIALVVLGALLWWIAKHYDAPPVPRSPK